MYFAQLPMTLGSLPSEIAIQSIKDGLFIPDGMKQGVSFSLTKGLASVVDGSRKML